MLLGRFCFIMILSKSASLMARFLPSEDTSRWLYVGGEDSPRDQEYQEVDG